MEMLTCWISLLGYFVFTLFTADNRGSACEAPSSLDCFKKSVNETVYICEWSMNTTDRDVKFDLHLDTFSCKNNEIRGIKTTTKLIVEECVFKHKAANIAVVAHVGNSSCRSAERSVELIHTVKYDPPSNITVSWSLNNLSLSWKAAEEAPALAEIRYRQDGNLTESWEKRLINTTLLKKHSFQAVHNSRPVPKEEKSKNRVIIVNLRKHSAYHVQIRQRPTQVKNPLWSKWSPAVIAPAELEYAPQVNVTTKLLSGTREVTLTWKPMPGAAAVVTYKLKYTQFSHGHHCAETATKPRHIHTNNYTVVLHVSYAAIEISITARNEAGSSPTAVVQVPAVPVPNLQPCDRKPKFKKKPCRQWFEVSDDNLENVTISSQSTKDNIKAVKKDDLKDYVGYIYYEHIRDGGKPRTVKTCLYYKDEGEPHGTPQNFSVVSETETSVNLSWKPIASADQRGFLTHYRLCSVKMNSDQSTECHNISATLTKYHLENLTPGARYDISLAGVTKVGEGPKASATVNTWPEKHENVWWVFALLFGLTLIPTICTIILKRTRHKICPPVPKPIIPSFSSHQADDQEMHEGKEEVHELMVLQHPGEKSDRDNAEETIDLGEEWETGIDKDVEGDGEGLKNAQEISREDPGCTDQLLRRSTEGEITDLEQLDNEIAMLIYKNGLVFDVKADLS
ncbi:uncharacterized protein il12rb1 isoform X2 [Cynoglossus semilaevis]|uniref:uncharacterized protein il12rb1 isoform X2 n=1 Tax=Cynoglossus semilaevis TaxID=244447 RepID=UPI0007DCB435|nr:uncharacterized protein LOC103395987 isoform X2 [Cynoglossus semilaevis]